MTYARVDILSYRPNKIKTYRQYLRFLQNHRFEPQTRVEPVYIGCIYLVTIYTCNNYQQLY